MKHIEEAYVSDEIAQMLYDLGMTKGEGFDCSWHKEVVPVTQQRAMRWLRKKKGIVIEIKVRHNNNLGGLPLFEYQYCVYNGFDRHLDKSHFYEEPENCIDNAIIWCLNNLIK